jgi:hypothetical protein
MENDAINAATCSNSDWLNYQETSLAWLDSLALREVESRLPVFYYPRHLGILITQP